MQTYDSAEVLENHVLDSRSYDEMIAALDFAAIEQRDHQTLARWFEADARRTVRAVADRLGYNRCYFSSMVSGYRAITKQAAARINEELGLGLWGVPKRRPKLRIRTQYRIKYDEAPAQTPE